MTIKRYVPHSSPCAYFWIHLHIKELDCVHQKHCEGNKTFKGFIIELSLLTPIRFGAFFSVSLGCLHAIHLYSGRWRQISNLKTSTRRCVCAIKSVRSNTCMRAIYNQRETCTYSSKQLVFELSFVGNYDHYFNVFEHAYKETKKQVQQHDGSMHFECFRAD